MTLDREGLKRWYREAMRRRLGELRDLREGLLAGDPLSIDAARAVAQALRGSGATYGYPELSAAAEMVEAAGDAAVYRRVEGLIEDVRGLAFEGEPEGEGVGAEWLEVAASQSEAEWTPGGFESLQSAWSEVCERHGLAAAELARRVASNFGLDAAEELASTRAAMRLVPEALIRSKGVLPLREDSERITVATSDPSSLEVEAELVRITGRTPVFLVCGPDELQRGIAAALEVGGRPPVSTAMETLGRDATEAPGDLTEAPERDAAGPSPRVAREEKAEERILVVDDDPSARVLARRLLEKGGYAVAEAGDGEEALNALREDAGVSLIVADLNMPRLDGLELIWEVRERSSLRGIPVIVVTGETDEILEAKLIEEGADDYIRKPLDPRLFLARVAATIRRAEH